MLNSNINSQMASTQAKDKCYTRWRHLVEANRGVSVTLRQPGVCFMCLALYVLITSQQCSATGKI